jgi:glutathione S-transferase
MGIILYDLAGEDPSLRFSPYCWRTRLALAHKGLEVETIPWRFTEKDVIAPSMQGRVPVIVDGGRWISDSWAIATYLELTYPDNPTLFSGMAGHALSRLYSAHADILVGTIFPFIALDIFANLHEKDSQYFRSSREARVGKPLEAFVAGRQDRLAPFRESLAPFRLVLKTQPFFGGEQPLYADYALFGPFQWARCTSSFALLEGTDPMHAWFERMLDLFDGLGRNAPAYNRA